MESTNNTNNFPHSGGTGGGSKEHKQAFIARLRNMITTSKETIETINSIDPRLTAYLLDVNLRNEGEMDVHNIDEVAGCCRFLRMAAAYKMDVARIQRLIKLAEKLEWDTKEGYPQKIQLTPLQVYIIAGTVGFLVEKEVTSYGKTFTEERQLVQEAIWFITRKSAKTALDALFMLDDLLYGDVDAECHVVSNNLDQSMIAYGAFKKLLMRIPGSKQAIKMNQRETRWLEGQKRTAAVCCHTAGGDAKDGAKASIVIADEYGSAKYVKERCDMSNAIHVYTSSMGTRKNHLWITSTTAGRVCNGPFELYLRGAQQALYKELEYTYDQQAPEDWQFLIAMHPDLWEYSDEYFCQPRLWYKCNPHIGTTVQSTYYEEEWQKAINNPDYKKEVLTKLFNQFVSDSNRPWIQAEDIRKLQTELRIDQLDTRDWICFIGLDFSKGDDLHTMAYNCYCNNKQSKYYGHYFWDCDCWIAEDQLTGNPNAVLYREFVEQGDLHVSEDKVIPSHKLIDRLEEVNKHVRIIRIGYDSYDAKDYLNDITTWVEGKLKAQGKSNKAIAEILKAMIQPVSQTWASYSSAVQIMWKQVYQKPAIVHVSKNSLLPWTFQNGTCDEDRMGNVKIIKKSANAKVDPVQALQSGIIMMQQLKV